jgi:hypothetical protein
MRTLADSAHTVRTIVMKYENSVKNGMIKEILALHITSNFTPFLLNCIYNIFFIVDFH